MDQLVQVAKIWPFNHEIVNSSLKSSSFIRINCRDPNSLFIPAPRSGKSLQDCNALANQTQSDNPTVTTTNNRISPHSYLLQRWNIIAIDKE